MDKEKVVAAKREIKRLVKAINELEASSQGPGFYYCGSKHTGAVRRASMDVTRALADLRRW